ncbi:sigma factor-like helix-turn-helix DNA-binding protein [Neobacillus sp. SAB-20_R2A]|uniref:sigma factor-like helix-turn-helix DNA-binding protein n=1 Tax=Neobacillus sp. SAB-20_R2A TaxID=3120519 RepID=UPI003C6E9DC4
MKNGPVISNISLINKAFSELGSPLHYKLIVDYLRVNWDFGKGIIEAEAKKILNYALDAGFYYEEVKEQHFQRKQFSVANLDSLYDQLKYQKVPVKQNGKNPLYNLKDLYSDPRFTIMVTETNDTYILLSEWNLLNDLAIKLFIEEHLEKIPFFDALQRVKEHFQISDPNALFFPHFDSRFVVTKSGKVSLKSYDESQIVTYSIEITDFIREEVARRSPKILAYLKERYGEPLKIHELIKTVFQIEAHAPKFPAYYTAVKEHLDASSSVYFTNNGEHVTYLEEELASITDKVSLQGVTDTIIIDRQIQHIPLGTVAVEDSVAKIQTSGQRESRTSLTYTLRYYDRIQETLTAHYFRDWLSENELHIELLDGKESASLMFFFDEVHKVIFGTHLENLMSDYALIPGQKLHFQLTEEGTLTLKIGYVKDADLKEQERYIDIARLAEENKLSTKSLLQIVTESLIYHPSGLHVSEIVRLVKEESPYAESSITGLLSTQAFFEKIPGQLGFWRFNPAKWKKRNYDLLIQQTKVQPAAKEKFKHKPQQVKTMDERIEAVAKAARKKRTKLTNEMYQLMDKNAFIELAWNVYANNIYNYAKRYASNEIPMEDYFQQAYFALLKSYENYNPEYKGSFYNYFKLHLSNFFTRYKQNHKNLIRIPVHRLEVIEKADKESETQLLLEGSTVRLDKDLEIDYTTYKTNYLSFEELYCYENNFEDSEEDVSRGWITSYFSRPSEWEPQFCTDYRSPLFDVTEPDHASYQEMIYEEDYQLVDKDFFGGLLEFVDVKYKSIRPSDVLKNRFGMNPENCDNTLEQVGSKLGVTRERVRQIEVKALERARVYCKQAGYKAEHFDW